MSKLFEFPEYPELEEFKEKEKVEVTEKQFKDISEQLANVNRLFEAVKTGQSRIIAGALQLKGGAPCYQALEALSQQPIPSNVRRLVKAVKQDINRRAAQEVAKIFLTVDKEAEGYVD